MIFRFHAGTLEDSIKTTVDVKSKQELLMKIREHYSITHLIDVIVNIEFIHQGYDSRIKEESYLVVASTLNNSEFVAGTSNIDKF